MRIEKIFLILVLVLLLYGCQKYESKKLPYAQNKTASTEIKNESLNASMSPILYIIKIEKPSYLYGTMHSSDSRLLKLPEVVEEAIHDSDKVYLELIPNNINTLNILKGAENNRTLEKILPKNVYAELKKQLSSKFIPISRISKFKVWFAFMTIISEDYLDDPAKPFLDKYIFEIALNYGKKTGELETAYEQIIIFDSLSIEEQINLLNETLGYMSQKKENRTEKERLIQLYLHGDDETFYSEMMESSMQMGKTMQNKSLYNKLVDSIITERNNVMAERIYSKVKDESESEFFAIGAGHLVGEDSVVSILKQKGLVVEKVNFKEKSECQSPKVIINGKCYLPYGKLSFAERNPLCEKIDTNYMREYCYKDVALKKKDSSICLNLDGKARDSCIRVVAKKSLNPKHCSILAGRERDICYYDLARDLDEPLLCDKIEFDLNMPALCYTYFSLEHSNISYCNKIDPKVNSDLVPGAFVGKRYNLICKKNPEFIATVFKPDTLIVKKEFSLTYNDCNEDKEECLLKDIVNSKDERECRSIKDPIVRDNCYGLVAVSLS